jgi:hypothetical protein
MKSFSTLSFMLLATVAVAPFSKAEHAAYITFKAPADADITALSAEMLDTLNFFEDVGRMEFLDHVAGVSAVVEEDGGPVRQLLRAAISEDRDLQGCPPASMSCLNCKNHPSYGLWMCRICGNCLRRQRSLLEEMLSFNSAPTARVTVETDDVNPMDDYVCTQVANEKVRADIATLAKVEDFTTFASGLDPDDADFKVYLCEN